MQGLYKGHGECRGQWAVTRSEVLSMINMVDSMYNTREVSRRRLYVHVNGGLHSLFVLYSIKQDDKLKKHDKL